MECFWVTPKFPVPEDYDKACKDLQVCTGSRDPSPRVRSISSAPWLKGASLSAFVVYLLVAYLSFLPSNLSLGDHTVYK